MRHVYIHIPFCQRRCSYCNFNTFANREDRLEAYVDALCTELRMYSQQTGTAELAANSTEVLTRASLRPTIFLGGGTPTMLSLEQMERVLEASNAIVPLEQAEVTTEANPGTVIDEAYLRGLRALGINRISFGVQSLHDPMLRVLGRIHTAAAAIETYRQARRAGFDRINLDFIFGLPGQTIEQWQWTLEQIITLDVDHLSLYSLIVEEGTPLSHQVTLGSIHIPDDDATATMYELAMEQLAAAGYEQYEISNWARDRVLHIDPAIRQVKQRLPLPQQASHHNVAYWLNADYIACGAGAHGHCYPQRWYDIRDVDQYIAAVRSGHLPVAETTKLTPNDLFFETMMMGLRLSCGVSFVHFADRCGHDLLDIYGEEVHSLCELGMLHQDRHGVRLTERGRMLGNEVFIRFLREPNPSEVIIT
jgi:oxygen-independent coproporphyrinogen-3 oxidase